MNGTTTNYTYSNADELATGGSTTYTYDPAGNQTGSSAGLKLTYNRKNQTISVTPPGGSAKSYTYTGPGQAVMTQAGSTNYSNSSLGVARETGGSSISYTRDPNGLLVVESGPSGTIYPIFDANGSVVGFTNSSGQLIDTYGYDPYGQVTSHTGTTQQPYQYEGAYGAYSDVASGFIATSSGPYNPTTATYTSPETEDPDDGEGGGSGFANPYSVTPTSGESHFCVVSDAYRGPPLTNHRLWIETQVMCSAAVFGILVRTCATKRGKLHCGRPVVDVKTELHSAEARSHVVQHCSVVDIVLRRRNWVSVTLIADSETQSGALVEARIVPAGSVRC